MKNQWIRLALTVTASTFIFTACDKMKMEPAAMKNTAPSYYRIWQGFKKPDDTLTTFREKLAPFMQQTVDLYRGKTEILNNYVVAIPRDDKPSFIPDEFALVAVKSEASYRAVRETVDGKAYTESHWDLFDKARSKSAPYLTGVENLPNTFQNNEAFDVLGQYVDWEKGLTSFYIGLRKAELSPEEFRKGLVSHVKLVAEKMGPRGLKGYVIIANDNYEAAFMNWENAELAAGAFTSEAGTTVMADASRILSNPPLIWNQTPISFSTTTQIEADSLYFTK